MSHPEPSLRQQLLQARANLERQIEIIGLGMIRGGGYQPGLKEQLQEQLQEIEDAIANLGPEDG